MTEIERLAAIDAIRQLKAKYWRGVDNRDDALVRSILAEDCELDYRECCKDPKSGIDHAPAMGIVMHGRNSWVSDKVGEIVTVHQGHQYEIEITGEATASGIWYFTDRFFMPPGSPYSRLTGYGHYHETYEKRGAEWFLKTTRITRLWVEVS